MSAINGDKAKFHIRRKKKIAQRLHKEEIMKRMADAVKKRESAAKSKPAKVKPVETETVTA